MARKIKLEKKEITPNDLFRVLTSQGWNSLGVIVTRNTPEGLQVGVRWIEVSRDDQNRILKALAKQSQESSAAIELIGGLPS